MTGRVFLIVALTFALFAGCEEYNPEWIVDTYVARVDVSGSCTVDVEYTDSKGARVFEAGLVAPLSIPVGRIRDYRYDYEERLGEDRAFRSWNVKVKIVSGTGTVERYVNDVRISSNTLGAGSSVEYP